MNKTKNKQNKLEKPFYHVDNRKKAKKNTKSAKKDRKSSKNTEKIIEISKIDGCISRYKDLEYRRWIKNNVGCLICGRPSIPHHLVGRNIAELDIPVEKLNGAVWGGVVALCNDIHHISSAEYGIHRLGNDSFEKMFKVNLQEEAIKLYERYKKENK